MYYFLQNPNDPQICDAQTKCPYPVGPVEAAPAKCFDTAYSSTRVVPPFDSTSTDIDWRTQGVVRSIQDQGQLCQSSWAFSVIANTESAHAIRTGQLYNLSEQHPVDCDKGNLGCKGGWIELCAQFLATNGCIFETDYPYKSGSTGVSGTCQVAEQPVQKILTGTGYEFVNNNYSSVSFKKAMLEQPLVVTFAVVKSFYYYTSGVYKPTDCVGAGINHAMQAVGFGVDATTSLEYAIIRNQWGVGWGDQGYAKVYLDPVFGGTCGLYFYDLWSTVGF